MYGSLCLSADKQELINNLKKAVESILNKSNNNLVLSFTSEELLELKEIIYFSLNDFLLRKYLCQTLFEAQNIDEIEIELLNALNGLILMYGDVCGDGANAGIRRKATNG